MPKKAKAPPPPIDVAATDKDVADVVGLLLMTFGQGVNPLHVHRGAVRAIRERFTASVGEAFTEKSWNEDWKKDAATVLGWMAAVGRQSAHLALTDRRTVVNASDFNEALKAVMAEHHEGKGRISRPHPLGKYCT